MAGSQAPPAWEPLGDIQQRISHPKAKLVLGAPRRNAKHQLGQVIVRDFRGQFISALVG